MANLFLVCLCALRLCGFLHKRPAAREKPAQDVLFGKIPHHQPHNYRAILNKYMCIQIDGVVGMQR